MGKKRRDTEDGFLEDNLPAEPEPMPDCEPEMLPVAEPEPIPEPLPQVEEPKPAEPRGALVRLEVFLSASGMKWDQYAGFHRWASKQNLGPMSIPAWREEFERFQNRPV